MAGAMILSCPSCSRRFLLDAGLLGNGRRVKCGNCAHVWYQEPPEGEAVKPFAAGPDGSDVDAIPPRRFDSYLDEDEGPLPAAGKAAAGVRGASVDGEQKPARWRAVLPWAGLAASLALVGFGLVQGRDAVVGLWPAANRAYELAGMAVEPVGAGLEPVYTAEYREVEGNPMLFVSGEIRNVSDEVREVPDLVATAIDPEGRQVQSWVITPSARRLSPKQTATFSSIQPEGASQAKEIALNFKPAQTAQLTDATH